MTDDEAAVESLCKRFIADEIDLVIASQNLAYYFWPFDHRPDIQECLGLFVHIVDETAAFPVGPVRDLWDPDALVRKDRQLAEVIALYKPDALVTAKTLLLSIRPGSS